MISPVHNLVLADSQTTALFGGCLILLVCLVGIGILIAWQIQTPLFSSLEYCFVRRNRLPLFFPFLQLFIWLAASALLVEISQKLLSSSPESTLNFVQNCISVALDIIMTTFFILIAQLSFVRGIKGFGIRFKTIIQDMAWAFVNLVAAYPLILGCLWLTVKIGKLFAGQDFDLQQHETLVELNQSDSLSIRVFLTVLTIVIVPIFEETLFRGLVQSTIVSYLNKRAVAIMITSVLFAGLHYGTHFPAIFILSCCLGYAYEKSGSLLRPVFIHIFFNAINVTCAWFSQTI